MRDALPDNLVAYRRTAIFDQDSLPAALRRRHATKHDVWGLIVVLEGRLLYRLLEPRSERILDPQTPGVIRPGQAHEVEPVGPVSFFVEFYGDAKTVRPRTSRRRRPDDAAMGFAGKDELIACLNELLEAERAGARVALETARAAGNPAIAELMQHIQHDEARWCAMLLRRIKGLDGVASPRMGAFYGKAMAIDDLAARITFLNRGQGWVVRKLREIIPKVRDASLHEDLNHMLSSHIANITLANSADIRIPSEGEAMTARTRWCAVFARHDQSLQRQHARGTAAGVRLAALPDASDRSGLGRSFGRYRRPAANRCDALAKGGA